MSKPFDATMKDLGRDCPDGFLATFDRPTAEPLAILNTDLTTVTLAGDLILGIGDPLREIIHIDFQAGANAWKHLDFLAYNALLHVYYRVPVHTIVVLLRPKAAHPNLTGKVSYSARPGQGKMEFEYSVVRLWEIPALQLLAGALGVAPLAVLGALPDNVDVPEALTSIVQRLRERTESEATPGQAQKLLTAAFLLTGLRLSPPEARRVFRGVTDMRESSTYMAILDEGAEGALKKAIVRMAKKRLGEPGEENLARLNAINEDLERLNRMLDRILDATSWPDLLDTP
jgi:predicted transposase YdaD